MQIKEFIDELEAMGDEGERRWYCRIFLRDKTALNADEFYELLNQMRDAVPEEVTTAYEVTKQRQQIIEEAHKERQKIIDSAREQAQLLVSNDNLVLEAKARAEEIVKQAEVDAAGIRAEAEQWARAIVERLENYISRIAATVDKTKKAMSTSPPAPAQRSAPPSE